MANTMKMMDSQYSSKCAGCGDRINEGDHIGYDYVGKAAYCEECAEEEIIYMESKPVPDVKSELDDLESKWE